MKIKSNLITEDDIVLLLSLDKTCSINASQCKHYKYNI